MLTCHEFSKEGVTTEILIEAQVFQLREVATELIQRITELETKLDSSTLPEVLEVQQKEITKNVEKIQKAKALCAKACV